MAKYVDQVLSKNEKVMYEAKLSIWSLSHYLLLGVLLVAFYGLGLLFWLLAFIEYKTTEIAITNKRVIAKFGFISRRTIEINLSRIESLSVQQGILGRLLGFGSVNVSGAGNPQAALHGISDPVAFRSEALRIQEAFAQSAAGIANRR